MLQKRAQKRRTILEEPVEAGPRQRETFGQRLDLDRIHPCFDKDLPGRIEPQCARAAPAGSVFRFSIHAPQTSRKADTKQENRRVRRLT